MYGLTLITPPTEEPVAVDGAAGLRAWVRQTVNTDDDLLAALGLAARNLVEKLTGRQLVTATWRLTLDGFPWPGGWQMLEAPGVWPDPHTILIPRAPLASVSAVEYYDLGDTLRTLDPAVYVVDAAHDPGRVTLAMNQVWPVTRLRPGAVRVTFAAGYGAASAVPEEAKLAIRMTVAHWYEHRGDEGELPPAARRLLDLVWNGSLEYGL